MMQCTEAIELEFLQSAALSSCQHLDIIIIRMILDEHNYAAWLIVRIAALIDALLKYALLY